MNSLTNFKSLLLFSSLSLALGLVACGSDDDDDDKKIVGPGTSQSAEESSDSQGNTQNSEENGNNESQQQTEETQSSSEKLNEATKRVNGTCAPVAPINKGEIATWQFSRTTDDDLIYQILAPFEWTFEGTSNKTVTGNGLQKVNIRYDKPGLYTASLNVDGNLVQCEELQVQGIPISVEECTPSKASAYYSESVSWAVKATSEAKISKYEWSVNNGSISGTGTEASMQLPTSIKHKDKIQPVVTIFNEDNTVVKYSCSPITVLDPNHVDIVLGIGDANALPVEDGNVAGLPDSAFIQGGAPTLVQVPSTVSTNCQISCKPKIGSESEMYELTIDGTPTTSKWSFSNGCAPGKKYSLLSTVTIICQVK